jgi:hypothetical protein
MTEASQERALGRLESKVDLILADNERAALSRKEQYENQSRSRERPMRPIGRSTPSTVVSKRLKSLSPSSRNGG